MGCDCNAEIVGVLTEPGAVHHAKKICNICGDFKGWNAKPKNEGKRKDKNIKWRSMWKDKGFICAFCGAKFEEYPNSGQWQCDHIIQLSDGGEDVFENTMMLCTFCHTIKNIEQKRRLAGQRRQDYGR